MKQYQQICKNCGNHCFLEITIDQNTCVSITGNRCAGGKRYVENTILTAYLQTKLPTQDGKMVMVRSTEPISQGIQQKCLQAISNIVLETPVIQGELILQDAADCGVDIIADETVF